MAKTIETENRPNPIKITDPDSGEVFILDFNRAAVKFAEQRGFKIMSMSDNPETGISDLFFYAFRKNHREISREKTDRILQDLEGLLPAEVTRLQELYSSAITALNISGERKNARMSVEM